MDAKGGGIGRCLAHTLVMATVMGGLIAGTILPALAAVPVVRSPAIAQAVAVAPALATPVPTDVPAPDISSGPAPATFDTSALVALDTASHPGFDPDVERWRDLAAAATSTVQRVSGVTLDDDLLLALVAVESGGQPDARSSAGAVGLTQVEPATYADLQSRYTGLLANRPLEQPATNVLAGALYLAECARFLQVDVSDRADLELVLDAYNFGPRATAEWWHGGGPKPLPDETLQHATRIMAAYAARS